MIAGLTTTEADCLLWNWRFWSRADQRAPGGAWRNWVFMGGRGAGKTRAGAEWIRALVEGATPRLKGERGRVALIGPALADVREVMIEGPSGLRAIAPREQRPAYEASRRRLVWPNGAVGYAFSAEDPDALRGPQFDAAWCDEFAAWRNGLKTIQNLDLGLRIGRKPQRLVTTTPRATPDMRALLSMPDTRVVVAPTRANAPWLSPDFLAAMHDAYGETRLARQELEGELIEDPEGALWTRAQIEDAFDPHPPSFERVVIGVDPPASEGPRADACGIVVVGAAMHENARCGWVIADCTVQGLSPQGWASAIAQAAVSFDADRVVVEVNQGGAMVRSVLNVVDPALPIREVRARHNKRARAEPVKALYERGRMRHAGRFRELSDQMCRFGSVDAPARDDRVDALVWAVTDLLLGERGEPRLRTMM